MGQQQNLAGIAAGLDMAGPSNAKLRQDPSTDSHAPWGELTARCMRVGAVLTFHAGLAVCSGEVPTSQLG
jgi:hypothetical protein